MTVRKYSVWRFVMEKLKKYFPLSVKLSNSAGQTAICVAIYVVAAIIVSLFLAVPFSNLLSWITIAIFVPIFFIAYIIVAAVIALLGLIFTGLAGNLGSIILTCLGVIIFFVLLVIFALIEMVIFFFLVWAPIIAVCAYCIIGLVLAIAMYNDSKKENKE